jgi:hypothetical protein
MRWRLGAAFAVAAVVLWAALGVWLWSAWRDPQPYAIAETIGRRSYTQLSVTRTQVVFPGDCVQVKWRADYPRHITLNEQPYLGLGERNMCDALPIRFYVEAESRAVKEWFVPRTSPFDHMGAWVLLIGGFILLCGAVWAFAPLWTTRAWWPSPWVQYGLALILAVIFVVVLDLFTNALDIEKFVWDHVHYIDMAQNGVGRDNLALVSPFAYRFLTPLLAGWFDDLTGRSIIAGFRIVAYIGAILHLVAIFALAKHFVRGFLPALIATAVAALALFHVRFLLFDIYRPDHLAFPLLAFAMLSVWHRQWWLCGLLCAVGLLTREFLLVPLAVGVVQLAREAWAKRTPYAHAALWIAWLVVCGVAAFALPRLWIVAARSSQYFDLVTPQEMLTNWGRNLNIAYILYSYLLPMLLLLTIPRVRWVWGRLQGYGVMLAMYCVGVMLLTFAGGTDIFRFVPYLFVLQTVVIACLADDQLHPLEVLYLLVVVLVFNRVLQMIPQQNLAMYHDFYGGWNDKFPVNSVLRTVEATVYIIGASVLRAGLAWYKLRLARAKDVELA